MSDAGWVSGGRDGSGAGVTVAWALAAARIVVAGIFLWHGVPKAFDPGGAMEKFVGFGLPGLLGPMTGWVEVIAALLLLAGFLPRVGAGVLGVIIVGALVTVQIPGGVTAALERDLLILVLLLVLLAAGPGAAALSASRGVPGR